MINAYYNLHLEGFAHSVETYHNGKLVGGLYGVSIGKAFFGESMFHYMNDASKVALYLLVERLKSLKFEFIDVQQDTKHLKSLGAELIPRKDFLSILHKSLKHETIRGDW
jgi:leucyl/phenylalanyl-tRNA--protein transferase